MDLQTRKILFVQEFLSIDNEDTVAFFESLLKEEHKELDVTPMSEEEYYQRILKSREDSANGNLIEADDLLAEIKKWS